MSKLLSFEFVASTVLTLVIVVLDKAGKLNTPVLILLLLVAALLSLHPALNMPLVTEAPSLAWKLWRGALAVAVVMFVFTAIGIWVWQPEKITVSDKDNSAQADKSTSPANSFPTVRFQLTQQPYFVPPTEKGEDYLVIPNVTLTNSEPTRSISLDLRVIVAEGPLEPVNIPNPEWKRLQDSNKVSGQPLLTFPLNLPPLHSSAGYVTFRATKGLRNLAMKMNSQLSILPGTTGEFRDATSTDVWTFELVELNSNTKQQRNFPMSGLTKHVTTAKPPTLLDLFKRDFPTVVSMSDAGLDLYASGETIHVARRVFLNFQEHNKFIALYVPAAKNSFGVCMALADKIRPMLSKGGTTVMGGDAGGMTKSEELAFSGRVFIYHEWPLSNKEKADIVEAYSAQQLDVQFRGIDYLASRSHGK